MTIAICSYERTTNKENTQPTNALSTRGNTLPRTATHCNTLRHTATHCSTLQHTTPHCNSLQHTTTHCKTQPPIDRRPPTFSIHSFFLCRSPSILAHAVSLSPFLSVTSLFLSHPLSKRATTRRYSWKSYDKLEKESQQKEKLIQTPNAPSTHCNTLQHNACRSLDVLKKMSQKKKALTQTPHALPNADILADH